mgnify:CR=1 FL=1
MVFTKSEFRNLLDTLCQDNMLSSLSVYEKILKLLKWEEDDDPRDINLDDIDSLTDLVAADIDTFLCRLEDIIKKQSYAKQNNWYENNN